MKAVIVKGSTESNLCWRCKPCGKGLSQTLEEQCGQIATCGYNWAQVAFWYPLKDLQIVRMLTSKISWDPKGVVCCLGTLWWKRNNLFLFMNFLTSELHISQAFWQYKARQILTPYESMVNFCSNGLQINFPCIFEKLLNATKWLKFPKGWRAMCQKRSLHDVIFTITTLIWMWSF
jgi:hypothetical protein